jgi:hypothetical protein
MILVVDTGYASFTGASAGSNRAAPTAAFEQVMLKELIPMIDATYRTVADRKSRAMAGLSALPCSSPMVPGPLAQAGVARAVGAPAQVNGTCA